MRKVSLNSKGFGLVVVLLLAVVLAVTGGAGAYVYHRNHKAKPVQSTKSVTQTVKTTAPPPKPTHDPYAGWTKITNAVYNVSFYYPSGWDVVSYNVSGTPSPGADPQASQYDIYATRPTNNIENDACVSFTGGSAYSASDFANGSVTAITDSGLQIWQNGPSSGVATSYVVANGQKLLRVAGGKTLVASASLSCGQGMNVNLAYADQLTNADYQTAVSILKSVVVN